MKVVRMSRPSTGTVLGFVALVVAVVGTAHASSGTTKVVIRKGNLAKGAVTAKAIAPGAVKAKALAKGAVTQKAVGKGAVGQQGLAANAVTSSVLAPGSVYAGALGPATTHSMSIVDADAVPSNIEWTASAVQVVTCAPGERPISGGVILVDTANNEVGIVKSGPTENGWVGQITSNSGGTAKAEVQVVCLR